MGGRAAMATTPTTPGGGQLSQVTWRNPTQVDKVACQLILRCILHVHQMLAVRANAHRECAHGFLDTDQKGRSFNFGSRFPHGVT